ncbi:hypothetical protein Pmani_036101 [Petrolisthes manimaculis]|uniref:Nitrate/nitrite sensing protein domain-containing protein n=1 Tax=Petrolisthes manimaculis TaxID=1843537 RepID=A0AAE1NLN6_9EUCA|nr:hypothetical protein Pmani_036101 [Petrolisthes manimaculis]
MGEQQQQQQQQQKKDKQEREEDDDFDSVHSLNSDTTASHVGINTGCGRLNVRTRRGQNLHFLQMVILPLIPILGLIVQNCVMMEAVIMYQSEITRINDGVESTVTLGGLVAAIQAERLSVAYFVFTNGSTLRSQVDSSDIYIRDKMEFYTTITTPLIKQLIVYTSSTSSPGLWQLVEAYKSIIHAIDYMGRSVIYGLNYYGRGHIDQLGLYHYVRLRAIANSGIKSSALRIREIYAQEYSQEIQEWDEEVRRNEFINGTSTKANRYITFMAKFLGDLKATQDALAVEIRTTVQKQLTVADSEEAVSIAILVLVLSISPIIVFLVRKATHIVQGKGEMATYWLEGRDGLQLEDLSTEGEAAALEGEQTNPPYMHMVEELNDDDSPQNIPKKK